MFLQGLVYVVISVCLVYVFVNFSEERFIPKQEEPVITEEQNVVPDNQQPLYTISPRKEA